MYAARVNRQLADIRPAIAAYSRVLPKLFQQTAGDDQGRRETRVVQGRAVLEAAEACQEVIEAASREKVEGMAQRGRPLTVAVRGLGPQWRLQLPIR